MNSANITLQIPTCPNCGALKESVAGTNVHWPDCENPAKGIPIYTELGQQLCAPKEKK